MNAKPTVGLVLASYRYGHLAAHAIETALSQTVPFDNIYFIDDGAGDCMHLKSIYGVENIDFHFRAKNMGIVDNFNSILYDIVKTDYVMYVGADNWLASDTCEAIHKAIAADESVDVITYDILVTGILKEQIFKFYHAEMSIRAGDYYWSRAGKHHGSMCYRVALARKVGGYANNKTSSRTDEDWNLWNKMIHAGAKVSHIREAFLHYRRHKENFNKY